jgi:hypothetical protein
MPTLGTLQKDSSLIAFATLSHFDHIVNAGELLQLVILLEYAWEGLWRRVFDRWQSVPKGRLKGGQTACGMFARYV